MENIIEMSPYQKNIWNLRTAMGGTAICNTGGYIYSDEMTDYCIWQDVLRAVFRTSSALRIQMDGKGRIYEVPYSEYVLPYIDRRGVEKEYVIAEMESWMQQTMEDIDTPLYDCRHIRTDEGVYMFGRFSHLIMDGMAFANLMQCYEKYYYQILENGYADEKEDFGYITYLQECEWKNREHSVAYEWYRNKIKELQKVETGFSAYKSAHASNCAVVLTEHMTELVRRYAKEHGITVESIAFGVVATVLGNMINQDMVVIGRSVLNRNLKQMKQIGMYANTQPVFLRWNNKKTDELLKETAYTLKEQLRFADYSFSDLKKDMHLDGPLFDMVISYRNRKLLPRMQHGEIGELFNGNLEVPFRLNWNEDEKETQLELQFSVADWKQSDGILFLKRIVNVLEALLSGDAEYTVELPVWCKEDEEIRQQMVGSDWNYEKSIVEQFFDNICNTNDEPIICDERNVLCREKLLAECVAFVQMLEQKGLEHKRIGILAERNAHLPVVLIAVLITGSSFFPLDQKDEPERIKRLQKYCDGIITDADVIHITENLSVGSEQEYISYLKEKCRCIRKETTAYAISTSGTTGEPKVVENTHEGLACRLAWMMDYYGKGGNYLQKTKKTFDVSVWELLLPLIDGGFMYVIPEGREADVSYISEILIRESITKVHFVPSVLKVFLDYVERKQLRFPNLKLIFSSGERLTATLVKKCNQFLSHVEIHNLYGPAECAIDVSHYHCSSNDEEVPIGKAVYGTELRILDGHQKELPVGIQGEICIIGKQVGKGYIAGSCKDKDADRFFQYEGKPAYLTGDIGRYGTNGNLYYLGRADEQVKLKGMRIDLKVIEKSMLAIEKMRDVYISIKEQRIVAFYTSDENMDAEHLKHILKKELPRYYIPNVFVQLDKFPIGKNGKLDDSQLNLPETKMETADWGECGELAELLSIFIKDVAIDINVPIFDLGLTSLSAVEFSMELQQAGYRIDYPDLYQEQTLAKLYGLHKLRENENIKRSMISVLGASVLRKQLIVCFPYAGGGPECFRTFADTVGRQGIQVWVVNWAEERLNLEDVARMLWQQIPQVCEVYVIGYCAGASAALAFLFEAEKIKRKIQNLSLYAAYPFQSFSMCKREYSVWDFIPHLMAKIILERLYGGEICFDKATYEVFRDEVRKSQTYMKYCHQTSSVSTTLVYGSKDPLTSNYRKKHKKYVAFLGDEIKLQCLRGEGHYFLNRRGEELGELFLEQLRGR